jgi:hypothetical protein
MAARPAQHRAESKIITSIDSAGGNRTSRRSGSDRARALIFTVMVLIHQAQENRAAFGNFLF